MSENKEHHIVPFGDYIKVFSALIFLTIVTVWIAQFDFGSWNTIVAMAIATVKATLVLAIFMHLKYDNKMNLAIFGAGVFFLILFFALSALDVFTRIDGTPM